MPIYEQHYRLWTGTPRAQWLRWAVITRYHIRRLLTRKGRNQILSLLLISGMVHLGFLMWIYLKANLQILTMFGIPEPKLPPIDGRYFLKAFEFQGFIVGLLILIVGSGLIAEDRRDNAIPLYLSKPLTPTEYILGKFGVIAFFTIVTTALPISVLFLLEVLIEGGLPYLKTFWWIPCSVAAFSLLLAAFCGSIILMASSLAKKGGQAGVLAVGLFLGHNVLAGILIGTFRNQKLQMVGLQYDLHRLGYWFFGLEHTLGDRLYRFSTVDAAMMIVIVMGLCFAIVRRRIRPVEVVT